MLGQYRLLFVVTSIAALLDQASKVAASSLLANGRAVGLLGEGLVLRLRHNPGVAWGMGASLSEGLKQLLYPLVFLMIGAALVMLYARAPEDDRLRRWGIGLILGGGLGNLIDRVRLGAVIDFMGFDWGGSNWTMSGTFNFADVWMIAGALLLVSAGVVTRRGSVPANG